jgi:hypothetical protein
MHRQREITEKMTDRALIQNKSILTGPIIQRGRLVCEMHGISRFLILKFVFPSNITLIFSSYASRLDSQEGIQIK